MDQEARRAGELVALLGQHAHGQYSRQFDVGGFACARRPTLAGGQPHASPTQPFPTVVPPFARQDMTVSDLYDGFMTPEEKVQWKERLKNARKGFYTPLGLVDTVSMPSVNGGALFFSSGADPTNGTVYVESKDMPSVMKLVKAGEWH